MTTKLAQPPTLCSACESTVGDRRLLGRLLRATLIIFLLAFGTTAQSVNQAVLDLAGLTFGHGISDTATSAPTKIDAQTQYHYKVTATVHGTGVLAFALPNGTSLATLLEMIEDGASDFMEGDYLHPGGSAPFLPFTYGDKIVSGSAMIGGTTVQASIHFFGDVTANGTVRLAINNVSVVTNPGGIPINGTIVFEAGSNVTIGPPDATITGGVFNGAIVPLASGDLTTTGIAKIVVNAAGSFTATVNLGGKASKFTGKFGQGGGTKAFTLSKEPPLQLRLVIDLTDPNKILGQVVIGPDSPSAVNTPVSLLAALAPGDVLATLEAVRSSFTKDNPFERPGTYLIAFRPADLQIGDTGATRPFGFGCGSIKVSSLGAAKIVAKLADKTAITFSGVIAPDQTIPVYLALYKKLGVLTGSLTVLPPSDPDNDLIGLLSWIKPNAALPPAPQPKLYPAGFDTELSVIGSLFVKPPANTRVLDFEFAFIELNFGNLPLPPIGTIGKTATVSAKNVVTVDLPNDEKVKLSIAKGSGKFSGGFKPPGGTKTVPFSGVLLQKQELGLGFFIGKPGVGTPIESGAVIFQED